MIKEAAIKKNKEMQNKINLFLLKYFGFIVALIVVLLLYIGYFYIIKAKQDSIKSNIEAVNENKENNKAMLGQKLEKLQEYRLAYESVSEAEKQRISIMIPEKTGKNFLFTNMEAFILRQGLILDSIEIHESQTANNSRSRRVETDSEIEVSVSGIDEIKIDLSISGVGDYEHFKKVLSTFEKKLQILDINELNFDMEAGALNLTVTAYYLKDKQDVNTEN
ncbi:MAG: hypothetical protein U9M94_03440 [Patescibacteria group bacterium]|nr:hypothetical protein [Patescibacteria group bacterium]MEA3280711.1 hypothetical protein [Thermodesulfobacteriota bacterium]